MVTMKQRFMLAAVVVAGAAGAVLLGGGFQPVSKASTAVALAPNPPAAPDQFKLSKAQWAAMSVEPVLSRTFREELVTEGKIAIDEDHSTSIFSPYSGRAIRLLAMPGDQVKAGQPLIVLEANETVQTQNDFIGASTAAMKAKSRVELAEIVEKRLRNLFEMRAVALRELQQVQADLVAAQSDYQGAKTALEAARNRLKIVGKTDAEIDALQANGTISPDTTLFAPLAGTVVQRKIGPGQYVSSGSSEPVLVVGDLSTVWLVAYVRESDSGKVKVGQPISFSVMAHPGKTFQAQIDYVAPSIDPSSRRRMVRATVPNKEGLLAPEMFATAKISVSEDSATAAIPRESIIYEDSNARVWVVNEDSSIKLHSIKLGYSDGRLVQVLDGVKPGQKIICKGSLFIDRIASGPKS